MREVELLETWGGVLVRARDSARTEHRFWFDQTDKGRMVLCAQVVYIESTGFRDYVPESEWAVPDIVQDTLQKNGFDAGIIYDTHGHEL